MPMSPRKRLVEGKNITQTTIEANLASDLNEDDLQTLLSGVKHLDFEEPHLKEKLEQVTQPMLAIETHRKGKKLWINPRTRSRY